MRTLWLEWRIWYYSIALDHIHPMHDDVSYVVMKLNYLIRQRNAV